MHLLALLGIEIWAVTWRWSLFLLPVIVFSFRYSMVRYFALTHPYSIIELQLNQNDELLVKRKRGDWQKVSAMHISTFMAYFFISVSCNRMSKETLILNKSNYSEKKLHEMMLRLKFS